MTRRRRQAYRRTPNRLLLAGCAAGFTLLPLSGLFAAGTDGKDEPSLLQQVVCLPLVVLGVWVTVRVARMGVWIDCDGVRIRNAMKTFNLPWPEIDAITSPPAYGEMRHPGIQFRLRDGRRVSANLFGPGPLNRRGFADDVVAALRAGLERSRGADP